MAGALDKTLPLRPKMRANVATAQPVSAVAFADKVQDLEIHQ
jgi:hypothetical protein